MLNKTIPLYGGAVSDPTAAASTVIWNLIGEVSLYFEKFKMFMILTIMITNLYYVGKRYILLWVYWLHGFR